MIYIHKCLRCAWEWASRKEHPMRCSKCKTPYWNIPKRPSKKEQETKQG
jgi:predicted Zn-ribbon and HTH transcriptional regulator